jgi:hypothetical protein
MHEKKIDPPLDLTGPWRGLGIETPPSNVDLLVQKSTILLSTQKTFNTSPAQSLRPDHMALQASYKFEIRAHNMMQDTTSPYSRIKISTQFQLRPDHVALQVSFRLKI